MKKKKNKVMLLYKDMKVIVRSTDGDTGSFDIIAGDFEFSINLRCHFYAKSA